MRADCSSSGPLEVTGVGHAKPPVMSEQNSVPRVISVRLGGLGGDVCECQGHLCAQAVSATAVITSAMPSGQQQRS